MKSEGEEWRDLKGVPGYLVSSHGRVYSHFSRRVLKQQVVRGYWYVSISESGHGKRKRTHRLVCEAFNGPSPVGKPLALHSNGNPLDNRAENLRWGSHRDNALDRKLHGSCWESRKTHCPRGHEYNPQNTKVVGGSRTCVVCTRDTKRVSRKRGIPPGDPAHGTPTGYFNRGCRCEACTASALQYNRERLNKRIGKEKEQ